MKFWRKNIMKCLLLILFLGYWGSITLFPHAHILDGVTIVHSHPYNPFSKENPSGHHHSKAEFVLISQLSHFLTTALSIVLYSILVKILSVIFLTKREKDVYRYIFICSNGLRAPPIH